MRVECHHGRASHEWLRAAVACLATRIARCISVAVRPSDATMGQELVLERAGRWHCRSKVTCPVLAGRSPFTMSALETKFPDRRRSSVDVAWLTSPTIPHHGRRLRHVLSQDLHDGKARTVGAGGHAPHKQSGVSVLIFAKFHTHNFKFRTMVLSTPATLPSQHTSISMPHGYLCIPWDYVSNGKRSWGEPG